MFLIPKKKLTKQKIVFSNKLEKVYKEEFYKYFFNEKHKHVWTISEQSKFQITYRFKVFENV